jgi:hypothetical protein
MLQRVGGNTSPSDDNEFSPVTTGEVEFRSTEEVLEEDLISRMGNLLHNSIRNESEEGGTQLAVMGDDKDLKGPYKFCHSWIPSYFASIFL